MNSTSDVVQKYQLKVGRLEKFAMEPEIDLRGESGIPSGMHSAPILEKWGHALES